MEISTELDLIFEKLELSLMKIQRSEYLMDLIDSEPELKEGFKKAAEDAHELVNLVESLGVVLEDYKEEEKW